MIQVNSLLFQKSNSGIGWVGVGSSSVSSGVHILSTGEGNDSHQDKNSELKIQQSNIRNKRLLLKLEFENKYKEETYELRHFGFFWKS